MTELIWDTHGTKQFETGVSHGVLYPSPNSGVPWNGLVSINHKSESAEFKPTYQDGIKVYNRAKPPEYSSTLEAYTYPDEFLELDGTSEVVSGLYIEEQKKKSFGLSYRTLIGSESDLLSTNYKIHLVYNALAIPLQRGYSTLSDLPTIETFSWDITTIPVAVPGFRPSSHFIVDSRKTGPLAFAHFKSILYGSSSTEARLPTVSELVSHFVDWNVTYPSQTTYPSANTYPGAP